MFVSLIAAFALAWFPAPARVAVHQRAAVAPLTAAQLLDPEPGVDCPLDPVCI